jgi:hypothetical protein
MTDFNKADAVFLLGAFAFVIGGSLIFLILIALLAQ